MVLSVALAEGAPQCIPSGGDGLQQVPLGCTTFEGAPTPELLVGREVQKRIAVATIGGRRDDADSRAPPSLKAVVQAAFYHLRVEVSR